MPEELVWKERAEKLWQLLDDIDTLGDSMKPEQTPYFHAVQRISDKRREVLRSLDGYTLTPVEAP